MGELDGEVGKRLIVNEMVSRVRQLQKENDVLDVRLRNPDLSDSDYDLLSGLRDSNIGEQKAYRRVEDLLRGL
jgi:hypothetical protein